MTKTASSTLPPAACEGGPSIHASVSLSEPQSLPSAPGLRGSFLLLPETRMGLSSPGDLTQEGQGEAGGEPCSSGGSPGSLKKSGVSLTHLPARHWQK